MCYLITTYFPAPVTYAHPALISPYRVIFITPEILHRLNNREGSALAFTRSQAVAQERDTLGICLVSYTRIGKIWLNRDEVRGSKANLRSS